MSVTDSVGNLIFCKRFRSCSRFNTVQIANYCFIVPVLWPWVSYCMHSGANVELIRGSVDLLQ